LFPSDAEKAFETMALAFSEKNKWDLRWFRMQIIGYTVAGILISAFSVSVIEYIFDFSLVGWLFNLGG
tara:strand:+ start:397 stop:600 length:204 start_codon:yes stop_codon:yes gene_type:complete